MIPDLRRCSDNEVSRLTFPLWNSFVDTVEENELSSIEN